MQLTGKHELNAVPERIWDMLLDADTLASIIPGVSRLEKTGESTFNSFLEIKIGPVSGSFTGNLRLEDINEKKEFTLKVQQNSKIGNANAVIKIVLVRLNDKQTEVSFDGTVKLSGLLASMGQRILGGVANMLTQQFFSNLEKEIEKVPVV